MKLKYIVRENTWSRGYVPCGWGNGYVFLPEGHPCYGMDYNEIHDTYEIDVNGGLTFSEHSNNLEHWKDKPEGNYWVVGFDTAHYGDSLTRWPKESVEFETKRLMDQLEAIAVTP